MKNTAAMQLGRLGGSVKSAAKAAAAAQNSKLGALVKSAQARLVCNANHSGNRSLAFDASWFQCSGCGQFHSISSVEIALAGPVTDVTGSGGVVRRK